MTREKLQKFIDDLGKINKEDKIKIVATYLADNGEDVEKVLSDLESYG